MRKLYEIPEAEELRTELEMGLLQDTVKPGDPIIEDVMPEDDFNE